MLVAQGISKSFGKREILHDIDISINPGEITAIIGPSGGGKTTLLRSLSLIDPPTTGTIEFEGRRYAFDGKTEASFTPPWPKMMVVFQQLFLWPHMTLRQNILFPLQARKLAKGKHVDELLKRFEMDEFIDRYPNQVSLGQRQRAAIVRALALQPKYILLDEVTSALDVEQVSNLLELLEQLRTAGTAILLITHLLGFARRAADQIVFLDKGSVLESGPPTILHAPSHERLQRFLRMIEAAS